jgi:cytidine deaminase
VTAAAPERAGLDALLAAARAAQAQAYAPYSRFRVGAALATPDGRVFAGCNVENAAYPSGTCAEAGAIAAMVAAGGRAIADMVVVGEGPQPLTPCGDCRQRIREFATGTTRVHSAGAQGLARSFTLEELLPQSFGPEHLRPGP